jgi:hypothetical protein
MNTNMSVIYITNTGHVIGAVSCNSNASRTLTVADVATPAFLLTQPDAGGTMLDSVSVPASVLSVSAPIPFSHALFKAPTSYVICGSSIQANSQPLPATPTLGTSTLKITVTVAPAADAPVFVQIQQASPTTLPPEICVMTGTLSATQTSVTLPITILPGGAQVSLGSGKYKVAAFVAGYLPFFDVGNL